MDTKAPRARLRIPGGHGAPGALSEVSAEGATIVMESTEDSVLALGAEVELAVDPLPGSVALLIAGLVVRRSDTRRGRTYGLWFAHPEEVQRNALPALRMLFDRRHEVRVTPAPQAGVEVWLARVPGERLGPARLAEISSGGLGLAVDPITAAALEGALRLAVRFRLPTWSDEIELEGAIRHRELDGGSVRVGLEIEVEGDAFAASKREVLLDYVRRRQRELLGRALLE